ncbi:hypothetical protein BLW95_07820 [Lacticaseibacillus paracasei]|nr:hypothetical protein BLW95_07820 [Lacticaseibacillus paracasei]
MQREFEEVNDYLDMYYLEMEVNEAGSEGEEVSEELGLVSGVNGIISVMFFLFVQCRFYCSGLISRFDVLGG